MHGIIHNPSYIIDLSKHKPLANGGFRAVFEVPEYPDCLVKVIRRNRLDEQGNFSRNNFIKKLRRHGPYRMFLLEVSEYFRLHHSEAARAHKTMPVAHIRGLCETTNGIGLVVEKIMDENGDAAPTMRQLIKAKAVTGAHIEAFDRFQAQCEAFNVVISDTSPKNYLFTRCRPGGPQWVCVDGYGEKVLIPVHSLLPRLNAFRNRDKFARLRERLLSGYQPLPVAAE